MPTPKDAPTLPDPSRTPAVGDGVRNRGLILVGMSAVVLLAAVGLLVAALNATKSSNRLESSAVSSENSEGSPSTYSDIDRAAEATSQTGTQSTASPPRQTIGPTSTTGTQVELDPTVSQSTAPVATSASSAGKPRVAASIPESYPCRTLAGSGLSYADAEATFNYHGQPTSMDADQDGVACETAYTESVVRAYWRTQELPQGAVLCAPDPCKAG